MPEKLSITEFLLAKIAEDEAVARDSYYDGQTWQPEEESVVAADQDYDWVFMMARKRDALHAAHWSPARVLAECTAKRAIIDEHGPQEVASLDRDSWAKPFIVCRRCAIGDRQVVAPCPTLKSLAAVYADHPDYNPDWKL